MTSLPLDDEMTERILSFRHAGRSPRHFVI
jgi:hypothetical protein